MLINAWRMKKNITAERGHYMCGWDNALCLKKSCNNYTGTSDTYSSTENGNSFYQCPCSHLYWKLRADLTPS